MEGVEQAQTSASTAREVADRQPEMVVEVRPSAAQESFMKPAHEDIQMEAATHNSPKDGKTQETSGNNVAMCGTLAARMEGDGLGKWAPPEITHDFTYPSDEEIVPNPKATFSKVILPRFGQVRSWFKGGEGATNEAIPESTEEARSAAPCLPITFGSGCLSDGNIYALCS